MEEEWKASSEIEAVLHSASRLTAICKNEEKLSAAYSTVMGKKMHHGFSSEPLEAADVDTWSKKKN